MKILIVDDEKISRNILLKKLEHIGDSIAVDDGFKALAEFDKAVKNKTLFDLIALDVSMPKMDGKQLLSKIRKKEKALKIVKKDQVKIIMVTSRMNVSTIKECIKLGCNGYLLKPVNKYQLMETLAHMGLTPPHKIQDDQRKSSAQIVSEIIKRFYKGQINLPVLSQIVQEIQGLMDKGDPSIDDLAEIIKKDIVISSRLISIANSPLYSGVDKADDLNTALLRLGVKTTNGLISALATKDLFNTDNKALNALLEKLWNHSFACACLGKRISEELGLKTCENIFLMGVVHDIGKLLLLKVLMDIDPEMSFESVEIQSAIHEIHTTFGAALLKKMRFSSEFIQIAEFHHWNGFSKNEGKELPIIHLADYLTDLIGYGFFDVGQIGDKSQSEIKKDLDSLECLQILNLDADKALEIADEIKTIIKDSARAF